MDKYVAFRSEYLLLGQIYPGESEKKKQMTAVIMKNFDIDSAGLEEFYTYNKKNPENWLDIEIAVGKKLEELNTKGGKPWQAQTHSR